MFVILIKNFSKSYLFFRYFKGLKVVAYDAKFFLKLDDFAAKTK